jgi:hypothetical protein
MKRFTESSPTSAFNDSSLADDDFFVNNIKTQLTKSINLILLLLIQNTV